MLLYCSCMNAAVDQSLNILVVEDELLLGMETADIVMRMGHHALGPVTTLDDAIAIFDRNRIDAAILDFDIAGKMVVPLAARLDAEDIPFLVCTGSAQLALEMLGLDPALVLEKPVFRQQLQPRLESLLASRRSIAAPK